MTIRMPHPMTLLTAGIILAAALTWLLPAGEFERREDAATGREVVVAGTYHAVERAPVGFFRAMVAIPRGMAEAADVIFTVFLVGGAFAVIDATGTWRKGVRQLVRRLGSRGLLVIPIVGVLFAAGGAVENMQEEIIALVPVILLLTTRLGFTPIIAVAMSAGAAIVGAAFSPINPFQVQIAQKLADVPLLSGGVYRTAFLVPALGIWLGGTMRFAQRSRVPPVITSDDDTADDARYSSIILALVVLGFALYVYGVAKLDWVFDELSAIFFVIGIIAGLLGGLGLTGTMQAFIAGFRDMAFAALLIGFARAIFVVLRDGRIIDTIVNGMAAPLTGTPDAVTIAGMWGMQTVLHVPVPSVSGQAVLTMPILIPLSDLLGIGRQVTIMAYQYGAGLCEMLTPTNGALMAVLVAANVRFGDWLRFALPLWAALVALGFVAMFTALSLGL